MVKSINKVVPTAVTLTLLSVVMLIFVGSFTPLASAQDDDPIQQMMDEREIIRSIEGIAISLDEKDWATVGTFFAEEIFVDFTSLTGGEPGTMASADLITGWSTALFEDKISHHMYTNHRVSIEGNNAEVFSKGYAFNLLPNEQGDDLWEVWGDYIHTLESTENGWIVTGMTFNATYARGNEWVRTYIPTASE